MTPFEKAVVAYLNGQKIWSKAELDQMFTPHSGALRAGPRRTKYFSNEFEGGWKVPFGEMSADFLDDAAITPFLKEPRPRKVAGLYGIQDIFELICRLRIEKYLHLKKQEKQEEAAQALSEIQALLMEIFPLDETTIHLRKSGKYELPNFLMDPVFIRMLYQTEDSVLIGEFGKYLPSPKFNVFDGHKFVAKKVFEENKAVSNFIQRNKEKGIPEENVTKAVLTLQRNSRRKKRASENLHRVMERYNLDEAAAKKMLYEANRPYRPRQCDPDLGLRLYNASKQVKLFDTVTHYTDPNALQSILDKGLYGRRTLVNYYLKFNPASLQSIDIKNGDFNAICMAANEVDHRAKKGVELCFDVDKLVHNNACVFYKQKDLALFSEVPTQSVSIGSSTFYFSVSEPVDNKNIGEGTRFALYSDDKNTHPTLFSGRWVKKPLAVTHVLYDYLISHDADRMHQILTLNFFRFVDTLPEAYSTAIYSALRDLDDAELIKVLQEIGKKMITLMEFNFSGAYQIDFDALVSISYCSDYTATPLVKETILLIDLIQELNENNRNLFDKARKNDSAFFDLLRSYRFLDYLLKQVSPTSLIYPEIQALRKTCEVPLFMKPEAQVDFLRLQSELSSLKKPTGNLVALDIIERKGLDYFLDLLKGRDREEYLGLFTNEFMTGLSAFMMGKNEEIKNSLIDFLTNHADLIHRNKVSLVLIYDLVLQLASNDRASLIMCEFFFLAPEQQQVTEGVKVLMNFVSQDNLEPILNEIHPHYWPVLLEALGIIHEHHLRFDHLNLKVPTLLRAYKQTGQKADEFIASIKKLPSKPTEAHVKKVFAHYFAQLYRKQGLAQPSADDPTTRVIVNTFKAE